MTVCAAALCGSGKPEFPLMVVGVSDRKLTVDDIQYEPPRSKIWGLTERIVMLGSGDTAIQSALHSRTFRELHARGITSVEAAAECYARHYAALRQEENDALFLRPLGLSVETFISGQLSLLPGEASRIASNLERRGLGVRAIITGVDALGAHIYVVSDPGVARSYAATGFAAIGQGSRHAQTQFMFARYNHWGWDLPAAMLLTYRAKRLAETAPSVGGDTDMFVINSWNGFIPIHDPLMDELDRLHEAASERESKAWAEANEEIAAMFKKAQPSPPSGPSGPENPEPDQDPSPEPKA